MSPRARRTLLFVGGGAETVPGILLARKMGLHVVVSDMNPASPGIRAADDGVVASTYDVEATIAAATRYHREVRPLNGVMCLATDVPLTVASVAAELGLPGIPVEAARRAADKLLMKDAFAAAGIPIPWYSAVRSAAHLRELATAGRALVVKPVDSRGARGVARLTGDLDPGWAFEHARANSPTGRVMVEEYLEGPQISTESILLDGVGVTPGFSDRNYEYAERFAPYFIENGGTLPSCLPPEAQREIAACAEAAGRALGITTGIAKGDMVWTGEGAKVIEIAARLSGGWFSSDQIPLSTGVDLVGAAIRLALGDKVTPEDVTPRRSRGVAIRYFFPAPGRITAIRGREQAAAMPGVHKLGFFVAPGEVVAQATNHTQRAGYVITSGASRTEAAARAEAVIAAVTIETVSAS